MSSCLSGRGRGVNHFQDDGTVESQLYILGF